MHPVVPPERIPTKPTRRKTHSNSDDGYDTRHICRDPHEIRVRPVRSVAEICLRPEDIYQRSTTSQPIPRQPYQKSRPECTSPTSTVAVSQWSSSNRTDTPHREACIQFEANPPRYIQAIPISDAHHRHEDSYSAWWDSAQCVRGSVWCRVRGEAESIRKQRKYDGTVPEHDRIWESSLRNSGR